MIIRKIQMHCDHEGCEAVYPPEPVNGDIFIGADLRSNAGPGWAKIRKADFCPEHSPKKPIAYEPVPMPGTHDR
jgi:hypothetical protein